MPGIHATHEEIATAFNRWMQDRIDNPEKFSSIESEIAKYLKEQCGDTPPSYGDICAATLASYLKP